MLAEWRPWRIRTRQKNFAVDSIFSPDNTLANPPPSERVVRDQTLHHSQCRGEVRYIYTIYVIYTHHAMDSQ